MFRIKEFMVTGVTGDQTWHFWEYFWEPNIYWLLIPKHGLWLNIMVQ
jgi:hypothetical protein